MKNTYKMVHSIDFSLPIETVHFFLDLMCDQCKFRTHLPLPLQNNPIS